MKTQSGTWQKQRTELFSNDTQTGTACKWHVWVGGPVQGGGSWAVDILCKVNLIESNSATPWTIAGQAPLSRGFSRPEDCNGLLVPSSRRSSWPRDQTHLFLSLLHWQADSLPVVALGNPKAGLIWGIICISLVAQMGKNVLAMQETQVQSLGQEDPLVKGMVTHFNILG